MSNPENAEATTVTPEERVKLGAQKKRVLHVLVSEQAFLNAKIQALTKNVPWATFIEQLLLAATIHEQQE